MKPLGLPSASPAASLSVLVLVYLVVVVAACSVPALCSPTTTTADAQKSALAKNSWSILPALFDFENYQRVFEKHYGSNLEKVTRHVYFLEKALAAYASGLAYSNWQQSYYLAVNEFSDRSPQELAKMRNNFAAEDDEVAKATSNKAAIYELKDHTRDPDPAKLVNELEGDIRSWIEENASNGREQGNVSSQTNKTRRQPRPLAIDQLIKGGKLRAEAPRFNQIKVNRHPKSNNSHYDPLNLEGITRGLFDQQENVYHWELESMPESWKIETATRSSFSDETPASQLPDEIFADLRETGCLLPPRNQGKCGACYAFAGIAMMEFLFCRKTGQLVAFSEQYMIDCAKGRVAGANGCTGGNGLSVTQFVHNFGLELLDNYKYLEREGECPYAKDTDLKTTGFYRMDLGHLTKISLEFWPQYLKFGPLFVIIASSKNFPHYGGGVDDGHDCAEMPNHAMVLVGHGREDGQEFWLFRNSDGIDWGHQGYYKLSKSAPERCIHAQAGLAFGTKDGVNFADPRPNDLNANANVWLGQMQQQ